MLFQYLKKQVTQANVPYLLKKQVTQANVSYWLVFVVHEEILAKGVTVRQVGQCLSVESMNEWEIFSLSLQALLAKPFL